MSEEVITIIGHVCRDVIDSKFVIGSGVFYGGKCLIALKQPVNIITKFNNNDEKMFDCLKSSKLTKAFINLDGNSGTTTFENVYPDGCVDKRVQVVHSKSSEFSADNINGLPDSILKDSHVVILSPICNEFPDVLIPLLSSRGFSVVGLDVQGFTRRISSEGKVFQGDWKDKEKYLKFITVLKIDNVEGLMLMGTSDLRLASIKCMKVGVKVVVATSAEGVLFSRALSGDEKGTINKEAVPFEPLSDDDLSPYEFHWKTWKLPKTPECRTGRGDTTFFSFMYFYYTKHLSFSEAASYTAALVDAKMQMVGAVDDNVVESVDILKKLKN